MRTSDPTDDTTCTTPTRGGRTLRLATDVTPGTPFGGSVPSSTQRDRLELMLEVQPDGAGISVDSDRYRPASVEMEPREIALTLEAICEDHINYLEHEALYVVDRAFDVTASRTFSFELDHASATSDDGRSGGNGAIVPVRWNEREPVGDEVLRGRLRALKDITGDMVDRDVFDADEARTYMIEKLRSWVHDDSLLRVHRED